MKAELLPAFASPFVSRGPPMGNKRYVTEGRFLFMNSQCEGEHIGRRDSVSMVDTGNARVGECSCRNEGWPLKAGNRRSGHASL